MAVVYLLAHGDGEDEAESFDEILLVIAVEDDGVYQAHRFGSAVEIEAHGERQPLAGGVLVYAFDLDDGADGPGLLDGDLLYAAGEFGEAEDAGDGPVFEHADQARVAGYDAAVDGHRLEERLALLRNAALQFSRVDVDGLCSLRDLHGGGGGGRARREAEGAGCGSDGGESGELDRAIGPIGERPRLQGEGLAVVGREGEGLFAADGAARPGDSPTDSGFDSRCCAAEPGDA